MASSAASSTAHAVPYKQTNVRIFFATLGLLLVLFHLPLARHVSSVRLPGGVLQVPRKCRSLSSCGTWEWKFDVVRPTLEACVRNISAAPFWKIVEEQYDSLPRLGIVVTTESGAGNIRSTGLNQVETYAARHRYNFHSSVINKADWELLADGSRLAHFFTARWYHLQQRHLGNYQWILALDGDVGFANLSRSLDSFLELPEDIVLHVRGNYEVATAAVLMRSTPFTYCFLEELIRKGIVPGVNADNGDLIDLVMEVVEPPMPECKQHRHVPVDYNGPYLQCFREKYARLFHLDRHLPIRVFFPMAGFWRDFFPDRSAWPGTDGVQGSQEFNNFYRTCAYPSDLMYHHLKSFDALWPQNYRNEVAINITAHDTLSSCKPLTVADELKIAQTCCFTHYPGCIASNGSNICHGAHCPKSPHWWQRNCTSHERFAPMD